MSLPIAAHDVLTAPLEALVLGAARARLLRGAHGRVLEVGAGRGTNLGWYPATLGSLDVCEADPRLRWRLEQRVASQPRSFRVAVHACDCNGPFPAAGYDTVVSTFSLCRAPDADATASALRGALAEGGRVVYLEHVHAGGVAGRLQALLSPRWRRLPRGCQLDRPPTAALRSAGLVPVEQRWVRLPPPLFLAIAGEAVVRNRPTSTSPESPGDSPATVPL